MNRKTLGIGLAAVLVIAAVIAFVALNNGSGKDNRSASPETTETPVTPAVPSLSVPPGNEDAELVVEINNIIAEVTKEALERPRDQRMTAEEINARIKTKIDELRARRNAEQ